VLSCDGITRHDILGDGKSSGVIHELLIEQVEPFWSSSKKKLSKKVVLDGDEWRRKVEAMEIWVESDRGSSGSASETRNRCGVVHQRKQFRFLKTFNTSLFTPLLQATIFTPIA
jgi:hypothetical protein